MTTISPGRYINPAFGFAILVLGLLAFVVFVAARDEDRLIDAQSRQVVQGVLLTYADDLRKLSMDYAHWTDAVQHLLVVLDEDWADENVGDYLVETFGLSASLVLGASGEVVLACARKDQPVPALSDFEPPLEGLLGRAVEDTAGAPIPVSGFGLQQGKPHLIAVARMRPHTDEESVEGVRGFLVLTRALDAELLGKVESHFGLQRLGLGPPNASRLLLRDFADKPLASINWQDSVSVTRLAGTLAPWALGATLLALLALYVASWRICRLAREYESLSRSLETRVDERTRELQVATTRAEEANQAKSRFLSSVSHELRTPLNAVLGYAQLLTIDQQYPLSKLQRSHADAIYSAGQQLLKLVDEVLDLSRIDSGRIEFRTAEVDGRRLIDECVSAARTLMTSHGVEFEDRSPSSLPTIRGDFRRATQSILNLLSNAAKYNKPGGRSWIEAHQPGNGMLRIIVADTGLGIPKHMHERVFEDFNRLGREGLNIGGTGVGLSLTRRIVIAMGGAVGFESVEGEGSRFWIDLPLTDS